MSLFTVQTVQKYKEAAGDALRVPNPLTKKKLSFTLFFLDCVLNELKWIMSCQLA